MEQKPSADPLQTTPENLGIQEPSQATPSKNNRSTHPNSPAANPLPFPASSSELIQRFRDAWQIESRPSLDAYLPQEGSERISTLVDLIEVDMEQRWRAVYESREAWESHRSGPERKQELSRRGILWLEDYCVSYPELASQECTPSKLLEFEIKERVRAGVYLDQSEYLNHFPGASELIVQILSRLDDELLKTAGPQASSPQQSLLRFLKISTLAQGGLGQVFIAKDLELKRKVAVKEILPKIADDPNAQLRFLQEAEVTGRLEHPGIIPIYSLGKDDFGRPFYAMRLISGEPFSQVINRFHNHRLKAGGHLSNCIPELRRNLHRLNEVCYALAYAHSRGVIHRDIKPNNIMIGKYGETLLIDWGLARCMSTAEPSKTHEDSIIIPSHPSGKLNTLDGSIVGTPEYMSPEQAQGKLKEIGPATDIYSLGVTLYYLLTSQHPFSRDDALSKVIEGQFLRPREVLPSVPPQLEAVCLRAMARLPAERYPTAIDLAQDIDRWLNDEPVSAYLERPIERLQRWVRHHRTWLRAAQIFGLLLLLVCATALWIVSLARKQETLAKEQEQAERLRAEKHKAIAVEQLAHTKAAIDQWLTKGSESLKFTDAGQQVRRDLLEQAARDYATLARQQIDDPELELERGRTLIRLGEIYQELGEPEQANESYATACTVFERLQTDRAAQVQAAIELGNGQSHMGVLQMELGNVDAAFEAHRTAVTRLESLTPLVVAQSEASIHLTQNLSQALINEGELHLELGKYTEANQAIKRALESLSTQTVLANSQAFVQQQSKALRLKGRLALESGLIDEAIEVFRQLVTSRSESELTTIDEKLTHAEDLLFWGVAQRRVCDRKGEMQSNKKALAIYEQLAVRYPSVTLFQEHKALTQLNIAIELHRMADLHAAEKYLQESIDALKALHETAPTNERLRATYATALDAFGCLNQDRKQYLKAKQSLELANTLWQGSAAFPFDSVGDNATTEATEANKAPNASRTAYAVCQSHLGTVFHDLGDDEAAEKAFDVAVHQLLAIKEPSFECSHALAQVFESIGQWHLRCEREKAAITAFEKAKSIWNELLSDTELLPEFKLNAAHFLLNCPVPSCRELDRAAKVIESIKSLSRNDSAVQRGIAVSQFRLGHFDQANQTFEKMLNKSTQPIAADRFWQAMIQYKLGEQETAQSLFAEAIEMQQEQPGNWSLQCLQEEATRMLKGNESN